MVVVELLVAMLYASGVQALPPEARAVVDVVLVGRPAVDVDAAQRLQVVAVLLNQVDRILRAPFRPSPWQRLAGFEVEWHAKTERRLGIGIVGRRHTEVHQAVDLLARDLLLLP